MNKNTHSNAGSAKAIPGAVTSPKSGNNQAKPIPNAVACKPKSASVGKIPGAITGPRGS